MTEYLSTLDQVVVELSPGNMSDFRKAMQRKCHAGVTRVAKPRLQDWDTTDGCLLAFSKWSPTEASPSTYNQLNEPAVGALSDPVSHRMFDHRKLKTKCCALNWRKNWNIDALDLCFTFNAYSRRQATAMPGSCSLRVMNYLKRKYRQLTCALPTYHFKIPQYYKRKGEEWLRAEEISQFMAVLYFSPFKTATTPIPETARRESDVTLAESDPNETSKQAVEEVSVTSTDTLHDADKFSAANNYGLCSCLKKPPLKVGTKWFLLVKSIPFIKDARKRNKLLYRLLLALFGSAYCGDTSKSRFESTSDLWRRRKAQLRNFLLFKTKSKIQEEDILMEKMRLLKDQETLERKAGTAKPIIRTMCRYSETVELGSPHESFPASDDQEIVFVRPGVLKRDNSNCRVSFFWVVQQNMAIDDDVFEASEPSHPPFSIDFTRTTLAHPPYLSQTCMKGLKLVEQSFEQRQMIAHELVARREGTSSDFAAASSSHSVDTAKTSKLQSNFVSPLLVKPLRKTALSVPICHALLKIANNAVFLPSTFDIGPGVLMAMLDATISLSDYDKRQKSKDSMIFVEASPVSPPLPQSPSQNHVHTTSTDSWSTPYEPVYVPRLKNRAKNFIDKGEDTLPGPSRTYVVRHSHFLNGYYAHQKQQQIRQSEKLQAAKHVTSSANTAAVISPVHPNETNDSTLVFCAPTSREKYDPVIDVVDIDKQVPPRHQCTHQLSSRDPTYLQRRLNLAPREEQRYADVPDSKRSWFRFVTWTTAETIDAIFNNGHQINEAKRNFANKIDHVKETVNETQRFLSNLWSSF